MATLLQPVTLQPPQEGLAVRGRTLRLQCPSCGHALESADVFEASPSLVCAFCAFVLGSRRGIWKAVAPQRLQRYQRFIEEYETIRSSEGRGSEAGDYYLALPFKDLTGRNSWQWRIRSRSFRFIAQRILPILEFRIPGGLDILDIGAGNCWLSYRLAMRGHRPVAVDLLTNPLDGLGAAGHYFPFLAHGFPRFQAEMDRLPFAAAQFDLAVFNASIHYSEDYDRTIEESLRCLRRPGHIFIIDTPHYNREESGEKMLRERRAAFEERYGFRSDSVPSREYLTPSVVSGLALRHGITWTILKPWYGLNWAMRPLRARLMRRREPAKFRVFWGALE